MTEQKTLNIYQRINEVRKKVEYLRKEKDVDKKYKVVTHDQVTAEIRQYLIEFGIVIVPSLMSSTMHNDIIKFKHSTSSRYDAAYRFEFVNIDDPSDKAIATMESHAIDNGDKAPGKALSYAAKYVMLKMFNIETGENEESIIGNRIENENINQALFDALMKTAKEKGSSGLEASWKAIDAPARKSIGEGNLKVLKTAAIAKDLEDGENAS